MGQRPAVVNTHILARWDPLFASIPVESVIFEHQAEYYQALQESTNQTDSAPFIAFVLRMILATVRTTAPQVTPQVGELLAVIQGEMGREMLRSALGLSRSSGDRLPDYVRWKV
ncbi:MAG: hypothetical protein MUC77_18035 [Chromatiaceae bacterium]|nr:hypothetical protein [Chromatiaceae bacterium]